MTLAHDYGGAPGPAGRARVVLPGGEAREVAAPRSGGRVCDERGTACLAKGTAESTALKRS